MKGLWCILITYGGEEKCVQNLVEIGAEKGRPGAFWSVIKTKLNAMFHKEFVGRELE